MGTTLIRFITVDDHPAISLVLEYEAERHDDVGCVGRFRSIESVPRLVATPDVIDAVVLDLELPSGLSGAAGVRHVVGWGLPVVVYSTFTAGRTAGDALEAGALGYVTKDAEPTVVIEALRTVVGGSQVVWGVEPLLDDGLSPTERRLLRALCAESSSTALADALGYGSPRVIDNMVSELYTTLGFTGSQRNRAALRDWARTNGYSGP